MDHSTFSRRGGRAKSQAKTVANRAKASAYWKAVRAGVRAAPRRSRIPPSPDQIGKLLASYCREEGIRRLEVFGSVSRGEAKRGSDVDLIATFAETPGVRFFTMEDEIAKILGVPVHLLTRESVEAMSNPIRRQSILTEAREIYRA